MSSMRSQATARPATNNPTAEPHHPTNPNQPTTDAPSPSPSDKVKDMGKLRVAFLLFLYIAYHAIPFLCLLGFILMGGWICTILLPVMLYNCYSSCRALQRLVRQWRQVTVEVAGVVAALEQTLAA